MIGTIGEPEYYSWVMGEFVSIDTPVEHVQGKAGEISAGPAINEDLAIWPLQQQGLKGLQWLLPR